MTRTATVWTEERKAELARLAETCSQVETAKRMEMTAHAVRAMADRLGIEFPGRRRAKAGPRQKPPTKGRPVATAAAHANHYSDPNRADAGLRRFSWEGEA